MDIFKNKNRPGQRGFTLIEMIIAVSIFSLAIIMVINVYMIVNNSQRKVAAGQKVQDDVRYLFEALAQDVRLATINYPYYADPANGRNLHPLGGGLTNYILSLVTPDGSTVFYRRSSSVAGANNGLGTKVQYCEVTAAVTCSTGDDAQWQDITPAGVEVKNLNFIITPTAEPFTEATARTCVQGSGVSGCSAVPGYSCQVTPVCTLPLVCYCHYSADGNTTVGYNFQPKVRIVLRATGVGSRAGEESNLNMETIVSTRTFIGPVLNKNYE
ncbi:MAG: type II secretion system protein [Patescibacteria group bacterium]